MNIDIDHHGPARRLAALEALRSKVRRLERGGHGSVSTAIVPLDVPALDAALPEGGIARGRLHEIVAGDAIAAAAAGFAALLLARLSGREGWAAWCRQAHPHGARLHPHGLATFGLSPDRFVTIRTRTATDTLWAAEECLRSDSLAATLIEAAAPAPVALRRLQLAAEHGGGTAILFRPLGAASLPATAHTTWKIAAAAGGTEGAPCWRVDLARARGGLPGAWLMQWREPEGYGNDEASGLALVADLCHGLREATHERGERRRTVG